MEHTEQCRRFFATYDQEVREFKSRFPAYCRTCKGWGASFGTYDPSPSGVSLSAGSMPDVEPCPDCVDNGRCPRCGKQLLSADQLDTGVGPESCPDCGWHWSGRDGTGGISEPPECTCWHEQEQL